jgi:hypothetical protein
MDWSTYRTPVGFLLGVDPHVGDELVLGIEGLQLATTILKTSNELLYNRTDYLCLGAFLCPSIWSTFSDQFYTGFYYDHFCEHPYLMEHHTLKNVNICLITNICSYLDTSGGQSSNIYLTIVHLLNASDN